LNGLLCFRTPYIYEILVEKSQYSLVSKKESVTIDNDSLINNYVRRDADEPIRDFNRSTPLHFFEKDNYEN